MKKLSLKHFVFAIPVMMGLSESVAQTVAKPTEPGINVTNMNKKIKPTDDFFKYVNGTWLDKTEIPADFERSLDKHQVQIQYRSR
jgi:putative endopeptidase